MSLPLEIDNPTARRLWLDSHLLLRRPDAALDVTALLDRLGFVQIDTIRNVTRAHNHILWSRNHRLREGAVWRALRRRQAFEHFTHDASVLPMSLLPLWAVRFRRLGRVVRAKAWYAHGMGEAFEEELRARIARDGPLSTHAFDTSADSRTMWARPPHKKALELMWYEGRLATSHRRQFVKFYDLAERVFPADLRARPVETARAVDLLCREALDRMGLATPGEIKRFWDVATTAEARAWCAAADAVPVRVETAQGGWVQALAAPDIETRIARLDAPAGMLRILNPFDPAIRDRARTERLFGFHYRNEMFVPARARRWGYYVYPLLEGDRFVGRLEAKGDRAAGVLTVTGFWPEPGVRWGKARGARLSAELARFGRLAGLGTIRWACAVPPGA